MARAAHRHDLMSVLARRRIDVHGRRRNDDVRARCDRRVFVLERRDASAPRAVARGQPIGPTAFRAVPRSSAGLGALFDRSEREWTDADARRRQGFHGSWSPLARARSQHERRSGRTHAARARFAQRPVPCRCRIGRRGRRSGDGRLQPEATFLTEFQGGGIVTAALLADHGSREDRGQRSTSRGLSKKGPTPRGSGR